MPRHLTQFDALSFFHIVLNSDHGQVVVFSSQDNNFSFSYFDKNSVTI